MAAKEMTVRACRDGGFVVYDRIQMVQNPDPVAAFGTLSSALRHVLDAMAPEAMEARADTIEGAALQALGAYRGIFGTSCWNARDRAAFSALADALGVDRPEPPLVPRDEPLMEDDRS